MKKISFFYKVSHKYTGIKNKTKQKSKTKYEGFTKILYKKYTMKRNNNKANSDTIIKTQKF